MDRKLAEFHFMRIFDIYREAYKIALALTLPLAIIYLAQIEISALALNAINQSNLQNLDLTQMGNPKYTGNLKTRFASEMIIFNVSKAIYGLCSMILSLFMTSAIVYTVACVYCSKHITFKKVMSAVPKLWKRLMITFLWFILIHIYHVYSSSVVDASVGSIWNLAGIILAIPFMIGFIYISFIWYMAAVVSILEDIRGIEAMKKGKNLIKEEFHLMGIFDIYREAYKVTFSWKRIFSQIALALILPLAIIFPVQIFISALVMNKIQFSLQNIDVTQIENPEYFSNLQTQVASEMIIIYVSQVICGLFFVIFSLLPTSAVIYTVACGYCSKDVTFKKVMSAVPKLWKRLMITFLWFFLILFVCNFIYFIAIMLMVILFVASGILSDLSLESISNMSILLRILAIPFMIGAIYISFVWYMASVVSILEDTRGIEAMKKGKNLIKGKIWIVFVTYILLQICNTGVLFSFSSLAVHGEPLAMVFRVSYGIFCLLLLVILLYFGLVIQTIIYFVCKSHHKEKIDKSNLGDHLDGYHLGHYVPLSRDEDIQLTGCSV
ncbi:hypothetical protein C5167_038855 [Papaver somniferum]|uniref:Transmembrane protein n=1 Tax=Papaver somniferum TaxID=3469 RepID=A0A4Y7IER6_PAPSO|nr:hypothetical protein C5167_038855 [Papaver somniferum]